jgi:hypothetical protein
MQDAPDGFEIVLVAQGPAWTWTLSRPGGVAARGDAPDPETAWRCGVFTAFALAALERVGARRF